MSFNTTHCVRPQDPLQGMMLTLALESSIEIAKSGCEEINAICRGFGGSDLRLPKQRKGSMHLIVVFVVSHVTAPGNCDHVVQCDAAMNQITNVLHTPTTQRSL